jgi:hypothetical protein
MLNALFWICLLATLVMGWRSRTQWDAYNKAHTTRTAVVNQIFLTCALAVATVVLFVAARIVHI